jgi:hypothetical protein
VCLLTHKTLSLATNRDTLKNLKNITIITSEQDKMGKDQVLRWYQSPALSVHKTAELLQKLQAVNASVLTLDTEHCIYVQLRGKLQIA